MGPRLRPFFGQDHGKHETPTALGIIFVLGLDEFYIGLGGKSGITHHDDDLGPIRWLKVAEPPPKKLVFLLVIGMVFAV